MYIMETRNNSWWKIVPLEPKQNKTNIRQKRRIVTSPAAYINKCNKWIFVFPSIFRRNAPSNSPTARVQLFLSASYSLSNHSRIIFFCSGPKPTNFLETREHGWDVALFGMRLVVQWFPGFFNVAKIVHFLCLSSFKCNQYSMIWKKKIEKAFQVKRHP